MSTNGQINFFDTFSKGRIRSYSFGFNGKEKLNEIYGEGEAYDFGARIFDPRLGRWLKPDALESKYPSLSPFAFCANSPIHLLDVDGNDFIASTAQGKRETKAALKLAFGENNGFKFKGDKLVYKGNRKHKDAEKEYVLNLFLNEVVDNVHNHVYVKDQGTVEKAPTYYFTDDAAAQTSLAAEGYNVYDIQGESTLSVQSGGDTYTTIFIGGYATGLGENTTINVPVLGFDLSVPVSVEINRNPPTLLWHGIGHAITNYKYKLDFQKVNPNRDVAEKQTVGFENLIAKFMGIPQRSGSNHGTGTTSSSGTDSYYSDQANTYKAVSDAKKLNDRPR